MINIDEAIKDFINKRGRFIDFDLSMINTLMSSFKNNYSKSIVDEDELDFAIKQAVTNYTRSKDNAIIIFKKLIEFLESHYSIKVIIEYPPIPVSNTFERLMYISKEIQTPGTTTEDLADKLWCSQERIDKDVRILKGATDDPIQVCGKKLIINDLVRERGGKFSYDSTVHPVFLSNNLTQTLLLLRGLKSLSEKVMYEGYIMPLARSIWQQLSSYAKKRILDVSEKLLIDEVAWYNSLEQEDSKRYYNELECSTNQGKDCILDCLKNRKPCHIKYMDENDEITYFEDCRIESVKKDDVMISSIGRKLTIKIDQVISSSYVKEGLV
jgi:hypothetical protein